MSSSDVDAARKRAEETKAKAADAARAAKMAKAEAKAAERAAEETRANAERIAEEKAALNLAEEETARRLAVKEEAAKTKVGAAMAAWGRAKDAFRDFGAVEQVIKPAVYRAVSVAATAKTGKDGNPAGFPDREDSLGNVERAIELLSHEEIDPLAERVTCRSEFSISTEPNPWKDLTRNERVAWKVVREGMKEYMKARDALDSALLAAYKTALEAAMAEMERLCEAAKVEMHGYDDVFGYFENREIKLMIRRCLASTAMPDAGEIVCQIRSSIRVLQGLDIFFETDASMILLKYEASQGPGIRNDVTLYLGEKNVLPPSMSAWTIRRFHNTLRRLREISDGLEATREGRVIGENRDGSSSSGMAERTGT